jgi:hypothetical protein
VEYVGLVAIPGVSRSRPYGVLAVYMADDETLTADELLKLGRVIGDVVRKSIAEEVETEKRRQDLLKQSQR